MMKDDFDSGMGIPDDELAGESAMSDGDVLGGADGDVELEAPDSEPVGRASGGARAISSGRAKAAPRKAVPVAKKKAPARKAAKPAKKARKAAKKSAPKKTAKKPARKAARPSSKKKSAAKKGKKKGGRR